eukprot:4727102-Amphidinium_carterae.1
MAIQCNCDMCDIHGSTLCFLDHTGAACLAALVLGKGSVSRSTKEGTSVVESPDATTSQAVACVSICAALSAPLPTGEEVSAPRNPPKMNAVRASSGFKNAVRVKIAAMRGADSCNNGRKRQSGIA